VVLGALVMGGFFLLFQYTKVGVGMRATAVDQEAALAQGISVRRIFALSWAIAGAVAVVAGMMLAGGAGPAPGLSVSLGLVALRAFPAIILGGLDSPGGAVVGGLTIGVAEVMAKGYIPDLVPALGAEFGDIVPYLIMLIILLVRPFGLFGTPEVRRV
jgi:branched-chain amino acid transport system permease protein